MYLAVISFIMKQSFKNCFKKTLFKLYSGVSVVLCIIKFINWLMSYFFPFIFAFVLCHSLFLNKWLSRVNCYLNKYMLRCKREIIIVINLIYAGDNFCCHYLHSLSKLVHMKFKQFCCASEYYNPFISNHEMYRNFLLIVNIDE